MRAVKTSEDWIRWVATGPGVTRGLERTVSKDLLGDFLDGRLDEIAAAAFFIAMRMKGENIEELQGALDALQERTACFPDTVFSGFICMVEPSGGYARHWCITPLLPRLLAVFGLRSLLLTQPSVAPKSAVGAYELSQALALPICETLTSAVQTAQAEVDWAIVNLHAFCPALMAIQRFRQRILKRTLLNVVERFVSPQAVSARSVFWGGYTHKPYIATYQSLARTAGYRQACLGKGVEGGVTFRMEGPVALWKNDASRVDLDTGWLFARKRRKESCQQHGVTLLAAHKHRAESILAGEDSATRDRLLLSAAVWLQAAGIFSCMRTAWEEVRSVVREGAW